MRPVASAAGSSAGRRQAESIAICLNTARTTRTNDKQEINRAAGLAQARLEKIVTLKRQQHSTGADALKENCPLSGAPFQRAGFSAVEMRTLLARAPRCTSTALTKSVSAAAFRLVNRSLPF